MATHSSILAWRIPWMEEPGRYSPWGHKESDTTENFTFSLFLNKEVFFGNYKSQYCHCALMRT